MSYGVTPQGFARKSLAEILAEVEAANIQTFGPGVIQSAQSPLGQLNGLFANLIAQEWELAEDTYQSYDPDQAEGVRLEMLGRLRLLERAGGEADVSFRQAITNAGRARIDLQDLARAAKGVSGVTYAQVFVNDTDTVDANGMEGHSVAVAVLGGDDATLATLVRDYVVPGVGTYGNLRVDTNIDGFCRSIWLLRPTPVPVWMDLVVSVFNDRNGCPAPSPAAIAVGIAQQLSNASAPINGEDVGLHLVRSAASALYGLSVEVLSGTAGRASGSLPAMPLAIGFDEIATFSPDRITITVL